ncbi:MAG: histidine phosphatase family protein [Candidatus Obscuribacterales bacterium]|nr:histidine phosphatase family protein [Candidatus Obscuribacterales bacterium]
MDISNLTIKICRHAKSKQNSGCVNVSDVGDHRVPLDEGAEEEALRVGRENIDFLRTEGTLFYRSPYLRVRQTMDNILIGANLMSPEGEPLVRVYEDPQLREVEHGYKDIDYQQPLREIHGWFYYRYEGGESPADCYDRCATFIESMMQQIRRKGTKQVFICTHGLAARVLVMRYLYLSVEQFESIENPDNCDIITIAPREKLLQPQFTSRRWGVEGLRLFGSSTQSRTAGAVTPITSDNN